jgi:hypothetical protein
MNIPLYGDEYRKLFGNMATLHPSAHELPNMTVKISAGGFWSYLEGLSTYVEYVGGSSPAIVAPIANAKWVVITLNPSGMVVNIDGAASATPVLPAIPRNRYPIALVYVQTGATKLTNADIFDARPIFSNSVRSHLDLMDTSTTECHPIEAIDGLVGALTSFATRMDLIDGLADKADVGGTASSVFKMNQDHTGTPSSDAAFEVERGSSTNVAVMWDESEGKWYYTNDGTTWISFTDHYLNDGSEDIVMKMYNQPDEPALDADQKLVIWMDADDADKIYLVYRRNSGDQVKVQLV